MLTSGLPGCILSYQENLILAPGGGGGEGGKKFAVNCRSVYKHSFKHGVKRKECKTCASLFLSMLGGANLSRLFSRLLLSFKSFVWYDIQYAGFGPPNLFKIMFPDPLLFVPDLSGSL